MSKDANGQHDESTNPADEQALLSAGLLSICKQLLGRVRVLEEALAAHPEIAASIKAQKRFRAAFEEDEFGRATAEVRELVAALAGALDSDVPEDPAA